MKSTSTSLLSSFATLKIISDEKKQFDSYQLLSEYIEYIISVKRLYSFSPIEMKNSLYDVFGFDIPEAVVKTATKKLSYISKINNVFCVNKKDGLLNHTFEEAKRTAESINQRIYDDLSSYIRNTNGDSNIIEEQLMQDLISFLIDPQENSTGIYSELISQFILKNENNTELQHNLSLIKEGSILYIGLNHNISETGSINKNLTLFLGTEVLFSLVGYNGTIYQDFANDFIKLVQAANYREKRIHLKYFKEVKDEIEHYFIAATSIVTGKSQNSSDSPAMKSIINNCKTESDVLLKKSDFFTNIQLGFGILEDKKDNYYSKEYDQYNLEINADDDLQLINGRKFISHINKLREGKIFRNDLESEYLLITNTKVTLKESQKQTEIIKLEKEMEYANNFAISIEKITNLLWYKLGYGFGKKEYPNNVSAVLKARTILASNISRNIAELYEETTEKYKNNEITNEQLYSRILTLQNKPILPEELEGDSIEEIMDFSQEYISRFEEESKHNKDELKRVNKEMQDLKKNSEEEIEKRDGVIESQKLQLLQKDQETENVKKQLEEYRKKEVKKNRIKRFFVRILVKILILAIIIVVAFFINKKIDNRIVSVVINIVEILSFLYTAFSVFIMDYKKCFKNSKE